MSAVDAVLFDLDDTLCEYRRSGDQLLALAFEDVDVEPFFSVHDYYGRYDEFIAESDSMVDLREHCFTTLATEHGHDPEVGRAVARAYAAERDHQDVRPLPGAREAVQALAADHRLGLVTNGSPEMQCRKLNAVGLADAFEAVLHAGYDAPAKPDPEPFHLALDVLEVPPGEAVHVGNSLTTDVPGAQAAGVQAAWLSDGSDPEPVPEYTLSSLHDLCKPPWR